MGSRAYNIVVVLFWLATMTWLVVAKVLPVLLRGDPPNDLAAAKAHLEDEPFVCWDLFLNDRPTGWAASHVRLEADGRTQIRSRIDITRLQFGNIDLPWLKNRLAPVVNRSENFAIRVDSQMVLDSGERLESFESTAKLPHERHPILKITGKVLEKKLVLSLHYGNWPPVPSSVPLGNQKIVDNGVSPRGYLPGLRINQRWTSRVYSPLRPPTSPSTIVEAWVERKDPIIWDGQIVEAWLVIYSGDPGSKAIESEMGRLWVRPSDGMVLKQELRPFGSQRLMFMRRPADAAQTIWEQLDREWGLSERAAEERAVEKRADTKPGTHGKPADHDD